MNSSHGMLIAAQGTSTAARHVRHVVYILFILFVFILSLFILFHRSALIIRRMTGWLVTISRMTYWFD